MIAKGVPGEIGNHAMILMQVIAIMGKYEIGLKLFSNELEKLLDFLAFVGEKTVPETADDDVGTNRRSKEQTGRGKSLAFAAGITAENNPVEVEFTVLLYQAQNRPAAPDLDVIAMGAEAQDIANPALRIAKA